MRKSNTASRRVLLLAGTMVLGCRNVAGQGDARAIDPLRRGELRDDASPPDEAASVADSSGRVDHRVLSVAANSDAHVACALEARGAVWCWNTAPCTMHAASPEPHRVVPPDLRGVQISVGDDVSCVRTDAATIFCWRNQEAREHQSVTAVRVELQGPAVDIRLVPSLGGTPRATAYARLSDGRTMSWTPVSGAAVVKAPVLAAVDEIPYAVGLAERGACESDSKGRVRCKGTSDSEPAQAGYVHSPLHQSDSEWRAVPRLLGARELGANAFCGWGALGGERVSVDCVYGPGALDPMIVCASTGCEGWTKSSYVSAEGDHFRRQSLEYRVPNVKRLVTYDFGLDDEGHCFHFDGHKVIDACSSTYVDVVGGGSDFTGLRTTREVRQFCQSVFPFEEGTPVVIP
jgi:hypothetical protein